MPKSNILNALEELNKKDIYSLILFVLYKMKDNPEYSTLSELIYILDNDSFIRFLKYFEGETITIPKIDDLKMILDALLFYERKMNTELTDNEIIEELNLNKVNKEKLNSTLNIVEEVLKDYDFKR